MRDIGTILRRVQVDLPITDEELAAAHKHLDEFLARRNRNYKIALGLLVILIVVQLVGGYYATA